MEKSSLEMKVCHFTNKTDSLEQNLKYIIIFQEIGVIFFFAFNV